MCQMDQQHVFVKCVLTCLLLSCVLVYVSASVPDQHNDLDVHSGKIVKRAATDIFRFHFSSINGLYFGRRICRLRMEMHRKREEEFGGPIVTTTFDPPTNLCRFLFHFSKYSHEALMTAVGEDMIKHAGGSANLTVAATRKLESTIIYAIPPPDMMFVSDDLFNVILDRIALESNKARQISTADNPYGYIDSNAKGFDKAGVPPLMLLNRDHALIKALCQRTFKMYRHATDINSEMGWSRIKYMLFCAPPDVCQSISNSLIQTDVDILAFQPWTCHDAPRQSRRTDIGRRYAMIDKTARRLFATNRPCGKILAEKLLGSGNKTYEMDSMANVTRLRSLAGCLSERLLKTTMDKVGCQFSSKLSHAVLTKRLKTYSMKKCATPPVDYETLTCDSIATNYSIYLSSMKRMFFRRIPKSVMCDSACLQLIRDQDDFPNNLMKYTMNRCYAETMSMTSDIVIQLGGMVTDLPLNQFDKISTVDLKANIESIKKGIKSPRRRQRRGRKRVVYAQLAKKMIADGKIAALVDSKEIMRGVSLKELKSVLSESTNFLEDLGINNVASDSVALTDSQKKWAMTQVLKEKSASSLTDTDIGDIKSLVTGLLSSDIKEMALAQHDRYGQMEVAIAMCAYTNWPRKALKAINQDLILSILRVRNDTNPMSALTVVDIQRTGCECLLDFNAREFVDLDSDVCSSLCQKIGYCNKLQCLNPTSRHNILQACLKCKNLGTVLMTVADFNEIGPNLISQMSESQIVLVPAEVLHSHIEFFKDMCLDKTLRAAVSECLQKVIGRSGSSYKSGSLYQLGSAIKLFPVTLQRQLDTTILAEMNSEIMEQLAPSTDETSQLKECCEKWLSPTDKADLQQQTLNLMLTMKQAIFSQPDVDSTHRRKRSAVTWTCSKIRDNSIIFVMTSPEEISAINDNEFIDCLPEIGALKGLNDEQKSALLSKAKTALKETNVCMMDSSDLVNLGVVALAFSVEELSCLPLNDSALLSSLGGLEGWSQTELTALATAYTSYNGIASLLPEDITMLGPILCGLEISQLETLTPSVIGESGAIIGELSECIVQKLNVIKENAVQPAAYGPVSTWDAAIVGELKYLLAGINKAEMSALTVDALEGLHVEVIPVIPSDILKELTTDQIKSLTDNQAAAVTNSQKAEMTDEQQILLMFQVHGVEVELDEIPLVNIIPPPTTSTSPSSDASLEKTGSMLLLILVVTAISVL